MANNNNEQRRRKVRDFIDANSKSPVTGAFWALIHGPIGLLYANPASALVALLLAIAAGLVYWPLIGAIWLACVVIAPYQVRSYNARVRRNARFLVT